MSIESKYNIKYKRILTGDTYDDNGKLLIRNQMSTFIVGAGNFGGKQNGSKDVVNCIPTPNRPFDNSVKFVTSVDQAALYRFVSFSIFMHHYNYI